MAEQTENSKSCDERFKRDFSRTDKDAAPEAKPG